MGTEGITATRTDATFRMACAVRTTIQADAETIWTLLTDAPGFPRWNTTVTSIEGSIAEGQTIAIKVPAAPDRVFKPRVSAIQPARAMVWSDGMAPFFRGVRTFTLTPGVNGTTEFSMREEFAGVMLPMIKGSLPDFVPMFEAYARDLKQAAETRARTAG